MISMKATTSIKSAMKYLKDVQKKDIPTAQKFATVDAGRKCAAMSRKRISRVTKVQRKYITNRVRLSKYHNKKRSIFLSLSHIHINPAGTTKYPAALMSVSSRTKTGRKTKYYGQVKAIGGYYKNVIVYQGKYKSPMLLRPVGKGGMVQVKIELGAWAIRDMDRITKIYFPKTFKKRYEQLLQMKVKKRATR